MNAGNLTAVVKQVGGINQAVLADGTLVSYGPDFGTVWNSLMDCLRSGGMTVGATVGVQAPGASTQTTAQLYSNLCVVPIGNPSISTSCDIPIFAAAGTATDGLMFIDVQGLTLRSSAFPYTSAHIKLQNIQYSHVHNCAFSMTNTYDDRNVGGIWIESTGAPCWLNYVHDNQNVSMLTLNQTSDSWVYCNTFCSWRATPYAIQVLGPNNNLKIFRNHIIVPHTAGLKLHPGASAFGMSFESNWIEPQDGYRASDGQTYGVYSDAVVGDSSFSHNKFNNLGGMGLNFNGGMNFGSIIGNHFLNMNSADDAVCRCISFGGSSVYNTISGNIARTNWGTSVAPLGREHLNPAPFVYDGNLSIITSNNVYGCFSELVEHQGQYSVVTSNIFLPNRVAT